MLISLEGAHVFYMSIFGGVERFGHSLGEERKLVVVPRGGLPQVNQLNDYGKVGQSIFPYDHYAFWRECPTGDTLPPCLPLKVPRARPAALPQQRQR
jgi:hypothetical protein